jgi:methylaspartate ammonia-lyase
LKIKDVLCTAGRSGLFNVDLAASKAGAKRDGFLLMGRPVTPGFTTIVQPGSAVSVMLILEDGQVAFGDCVDVIFAGAAGRDRLFEAASHLSFLRTGLPDLLIGRDVSQFREFASEIDRLVWDGQRLHTAVRYGVTQALLHAASLAHRVPMASVVAHEYRCELASNLVPMLVNSPVGDPDHLDRLILKQVDLLPHGSFTNVDRDLGKDGEKLFAFARRVVRRIADIGKPGYLPTIHLDVYGTLGELFRNDLPALVEFLGALEQLVAPHALMIESPLIMGSRLEQIDTYRALGSVIRDRRLGVQIVVDEWCNSLEDVVAFSDAGAGDLLQVKTPDLGGVNNSIEAVLYARSKGVGVSLGGSLNETDQSSRVTVHVALACQPTYLFAKPGYGADEALMMQTNEMTRTLALIGAGHGAITC